MPLPLLHLQLMLCEMVFRNPMEDAESKPRTLKLLAPLLLVVLTEFVRILVFHFIIVLVSLLFLSDTGYHSSNGSTTATASEAHSKC